jgi:hypothetical protein
MQYNAHCQNPRCRGVALISELAAHRTDATPAATQQPSQPPAADGCAPQIHRVLIWPQIASLPAPSAEGTAGVGAADGDAAPPSAEEEALAVAVAAQAAYGPGLAAAVGAAARATRLRVGVLPSTMPAKLMFVYQVRGRGENTCL